MVNARNGFDGMAVRLYIGPMPSPPYETFLFDLDGTLLDSVELILGSYRHTLRIHRGDVPPDEIWLAGLGTPLRAQFRRFSDDGDEIEAMVATYRDYNLAHHDELVRPYPGIRDAVRALRQRGARIAVVTSKNRQGTDRGLRHAGLADDVEAVVSADDVGDRHKPHPEPVRAALRALGEPPEHTVFVGDSPHDLAAGRDAGVATAAVAWGPFPRATLQALAPDHWIGDPTDLLALAPNGTPAGAEPR